MLGSFGTRTGSSQSLDSLASSPCEPTDSVAVTFVLCLAVWSADLVYLWRNGLCVDALRSVCVADVELLKVGRRCEEEVARCEKVNVLLSCASEASDKKRSAPPRGEKAGRSVWAGAVVVE